MAGRARLELDRNRVRSAAMDPAVDLVRKVTRRVESGARRKVNVSSGRTKASIYRTVRTTPYTVTGKVGAESPWVLIEHDGAKPHIIRPRKARALRFYWKRVGSVVTFARVNHPGRKGSKFLTDPLVVEGPRHNFRVVLR